MKNPLSSELETEREQRCLVLFTKPAAPGRVKTRLIGSSIESSEARPITAERAAALHATFLGDLSERLITGRFHLRVAWALDEGESFPEGLAAGGENVCQQGEDLGARLHHGLATAAKRFSTVAAIGSDHPELEAGVVEQAFSQLEAGADAVFGPVEDGGYYLVALRAAAVRRQLFDGIPWSTSEVLAASLERCQQLGFEVALLPPGDDVDVAEDLRQLAGRLGSGGRDCPRTRELLARWGWLKEDMAG